MKKYYLIGVVVVVVIVLLCIGLYYYYGTKNQFYKTHYTNKWPIYGSNVALAFPSLNCPNADIDKDCHYSKEDIAKKDCLMDPRCSGYSVRMSGPKFFPDKNIMIYSNFYGDDYSFVDIPDETTIYRKVVQ